MATLFWLLFGLAAWVYAGYPLLLAVLGALSSRRGYPPIRDADLPTVTLVISAFNERSVIAEKIRNSLELDYPRDRLDVVVVSDASDDGTDDVVRTFDGQGVRLLRMTDRGGKTLGLNAAVASSTADVVVFSDANAMYERNAVRELVAPFGETAVGGVVGESRYYTGEHRAEQSEGLYWRYETAIKKLETRIGSVVGGDGAIYAIRRSLYVPMRADALSDFVNPLQIVRAGRRCVYRPEAASYEKAGDSFHKEFRRKVRIVNRAWRATLSMTELLNPFRFGFFSFQLVSHKLLRWLMPVLMAGMLLTNAVLATGSTFYAWLLAAQLAFYALALAGHALRERAGLPRFVAVPYYFCLVNVASALGIIDAFRGRTYTTWSTVRT
jgi:cellulose synthase/poly-beta-1,6-N-acetylglucosamine synthase-like glycosyltransferase